MRNLLHIAALLLCATACVYPFDPDIEQAPEGVLVVDGDITVGETTTIRLGTMFSLYSNSGGMYYYASGTRAGNIYDLASAHVWVEDSEGGIYEGTLVPISGYYGFDGRNRQFAVDTKDAPAGREYRACVEAFGARYTSDWRKPLPGPNIKEISFSADEADVTVSVTLDEGEEGTGYVLLSYDEAWEFHAEFTVDYQVDTISWTVVQPFTPINYPNYWCFKTTDYGISYPVDLTGLEGGLQKYPLFSFSRIDNRNHRRYCANVKARTIPKETYRYLSHLEESTSGGGDLFTPNPGELPGNLVCETEPERMVLGYVTVSQVTSRRGWLDSRFNRYTSTNYSALSFPNQPKYPDYYYAGYRPLVENPHANFEEADEGPYGWGAKRCYDCIAAGGTKTKPVFWDEQ